MKLRQIATLTLMASISLFLSCGTALSATRYVDAGNLSGVEDGTFENPFDTIQEGLDEALAGDVVRVRPGVYYGAIELKDLVKLVSDEGPEVTIIDGIGDALAVKSPYGSSLNPVSYIEGFTIRNASSALIDATNRLSFWSPSSFDVHNCILQGDGFNLGMNMYPGVVAHVTRTILRDLRQGFNAIWCNYPQFRNITAHNVKTVFFIYQIGINLKNVSVSMADNAVSLWGDYGTGTVYGSNNNFFNVQEVAHPNDQGWPAYVALEGSLYEDPQYLAAEENDFRLQQTSPLIDAGVDVGLPYFGQAPDIGARESGSAGMVDLEGMVQNLSESYQKVPHAAYKNVGEQRRNALTNKLIAIIKMLGASSQADKETRIGALQAAREKILNDIWSKADGFFGGHPQNDWITTLEEQQRLEEKVSQLLAAIDAELGTL